MMFGVVFGVIGSKKKSSWDFGQNFKLKIGLFLAVFGQKPWTNPLGFWSKFQIC